MDAIDSFRVWPIHATSADTLEARSQRTQNQRMRKNTAVQIIQDGDGESKWFLWDSIQDQTVDRMVVDVSLGILVSSGRILTICVANSLETQRESRLR